MAGIRDILNGTRVEAVKGVSWPDYRELVGMNPSTLVHGQKSMLALKHAWDHPRKDTPDFRFGRAVHTILLEPREFANRYTYWEGARRGNDYKAFAADAFLHGQEVLAEDEWYACQDMALRFDCDGGGRGHRLRGGRDASMPGADRLGLGVWGCAYGPEDVP